MDGATGPAAEPPRPGDVLGSLASADEILALWPRMSDDDRDLVRRRVKADGVLVTAELFVCLAASVPEESWQVANPYVPTLFGPSWSRGLNVSPDAVVSLVEGPSSLPGPWLDQVVEDRWSLVMDSPLWEPMVTDVVHDAVATDRFSLERARSLHRRTCRDPDCVILELRPDSPWEMASRHLASPSAYLRRLAVQHPDCPLDTRVAMLEDDSPDVVRAAVSRDATLDFDRALVGLRRFVGRRELAQFPDRTLAVLDQVDAAGWERMAKWCSPGVSPRYVDRFMGHESWRVRAAFIRAHPDHEPTAERAADDAHPRVRAALVAAAPSTKGLEADPSYLVRKAVAAHTPDPAVLTRLAEDPDERVRRVARERVMSVMEGS